MSTVTSSPTLAADLLKEARRRANLSQAELAERAGLSQQAISAYETGRKDPTVASLVRLVDASGLEMRVRFRHSEDPPDSPLSWLSPGERTDLELNALERDADGRLQRVPGT